MTKAAMVAAGVSLAGGTTALAQQPPMLSNSYLNKLDQLSRQRLLDHPHEFGTPPPQSSISPEKIRPLKGFWVCRSLTLWTPIYAEPTTHSRILAKSAGWQAVTGGYVHGFQKVLVHRGMYGYVQRQFIHPFHDAVDPAATCTVAGTQPNGLPSFNIMG